LEVCDELSLRATEGSEAISEIASSLSLLAMTKLLLKAELVPIFSLSLFKKPLSETNQIALINTFLKYILIL